MKRLFILAAAAIISGTAFSQTTSTTMTGSQARIGVKAGVNLATYSGKNNYDVDWKNNTGFNLTVFGDFGVGNNFFIQPGISLQNKGGKLEGGGAEFKQTAMAIGVPLNAVLRIPTGEAGAFQINAGPYIDFNIAGKNKGTYTGGGITSDGESDLNFGSNIDDDLKTIDFGVNAGLAYRFSNGFLIGGQYGWGLTNLVPDDKRVGDDKLENRVISLSVGYSF
ncbi:outer membrane beta-barrel protein [Pedobacter sp. HMF7647]|uniref:Outer membrane beta-barrel protein n=1 Tax=Hufsiella arboris TaxID=2695275 RepID=A0A7K1YA08_9SPHI|nr:porin family protein [Hufsiella arboris]MXV51426.1 outer membrane beta-barrel protein [Hufsiella arboris]